MKKLAGMILLSVFFIVGCQDDESILSSTDELNLTSSSPKGRVIVPKYITLPDDGTLAKLSEDAAFWYFSQYVDDDGCDLVLETKYEGGIFGAVKIYAKLSIDEDAIYEEGLVTLDISKENGIVSFGPSEVFQSYAVLDVMFTGVDLSDISEPNTLTISSQETVSFVKVNEDGTTEAVKYNGIRVDKSTGMLYVSGAVVYSSADYAFVTVE